MSVGMTGRQLLLLLLQLSLIHLAPPPPRTDHWGVLGAPMRRRTPLPRLRQLLLLLLLPRARHASG